MWCRLCTRVGSHMCTCESSCCCSLHQETGGRRIRDKSARSAAFYICEREKNRTKWSYLSQGREWTHRKERSFLQPFRFGPYGYRSSAGLIWGYLCPLWLKYQQASLIQLSRSTCFSPFSHILLCFSTKVSSLTPKARWSIWPSVRSECDYEEIVSKTCDEL